VGCVKDAKRPTHNSSTFLSPYPRSHNLTIFVMLLAHVEYPGICALKLRHETKKLLYIMLGQSGVFLNIFLFYFI
jgi:hypothetical protein